MTIASTTSTRHIAATDGTHVRVRPITPTVRELLMAMHPERLAGIVAALIWQHKHGAHCKHCGTRVRALVALPGSAGYCPIHEQMLSPEELSPIPSPAH